MILNRFYLIFMQLCLSQMIYASSVTGKVDRIIVRDSDGLVYVTFTGNRTDKPTCATANYMVIKNESSVTGRQQLAILLLAQSTDKTITVVGHGSCIRWRDGEDINYIIMSK